MIKTNCQHCDETKTADRLGRQMHICDDCRTSGHHAHIPCEKCSPRPKEVAGDDAARKLLQRIYDNLTKEYNLHNGVMSGCIGADVCDELEEFLYPTK